MCVKYLGRRWMFSKFAEGLIKSVIMDRKTNVLRKEIKYVHGYKIQTKWVKESARSSAPGGETNI